MRVTTLAEATAQRDNDKDLVVVFDWLQKNTAGIPFGRYEIMGRKIYATVSENETGALASATYEIHRHHTDVHYCLAGGETIAFAAASSFNPAGAYQELNDFQLGSLNQSPSQTTLQPGSLAIFTPGEPHQPKLSDGQHSRVKKIVVKIAVSPN